MEKKQHMIRTHSDMLQFIKSQAPGAIVHISEIKGGAGENTEGMRRFMIEIPGKVARSSGVDVYSLPCHNEELLGKYIRSVMQGLQ